MPFSADTSPKGQCPFPGPPSTDRRLAPGRHRPRILQVVPEYLNSPGVACRPFRHRFGRRNGKNSCPDNFYDVHQLRSCARGECYQSYK